MSFTSNAALTFFRNVVRVLGYWRNRESIGKSSSSQLRKRIKSLTERVGWCSFVADIQNKRAKLIALFLLNNGFINLFEYLFVLLIALKFDKYTKLI
jgi:hypothetical protein